MRAGPARRRRDARARSTCASCAARSARRPHRRGLPVPARQGRDRARRRRRRRPRDHRLHAPHGAGWPRRSCKALGIGVRVDHHPSLKPFDRELLYDLAGQGRTHGHAGEPLHQRRPVLAGGRDARGPGHRHRAWAPSAPTPRTSSTPATSTTCCGATGCPRTTWWPWPGSSSAPAVHGGACRRGRRAADGHGSRVDRRPPRA